MFAKLFSSITESSLWSEPKEVRLLFVTMLAKADQNGFVEASIPGLARVANLTVEETVQGLECLQSPDAYSKNPDNEGRRVLQVPGGFVLLNYEDYRARRSTEERRVYMREYMQNYRKKNGASKQKKADVKRCKPQLAQAETETETETEEKKETMAASLVFPDQLDVPEFQEVWRQWEAHRREIKKPLKPTQMAGMLKKLSSWGIDRAVAAIEHTVANGWQGLREPEATSRKIIPGTSEWAARSIRWLDKVPEWQAMANRGEITDQEFNRRVAEARINADREME